MVDLLKRQQNRRRYYQRRVAKGKCWSCPRQLPEGSANRRCAECLELDRVRAKVRYDRRKEMEEQQAQQEQPHGA